MNFRYSWKEVCMSTCLFLFLLACDFFQKKETVEETPLSNIEKTYKNHLEQAIVKLNKLSVAKELDDVLSIYKEARSFFKLAEPILAFADKSNYLSLNQPNILKVMEEDPTDIRKIPAFGFQLIEELMLEDEVDVMLINKEAKVCRDRINLVKENSSLKLKNYHFIWIIRDQIVRVATLGITGFDSPLGNSLSESALTYITLRNMSVYCRPLFSDINLYNTWLNELDTTIAFLNHPFDEFNRYVFIREHTHKQLQLIQTIIKDWEVEFPFTLAFDNQMTSLFTAKTFNASFFHQPSAKDSLSNSKIELGKRLFNDPQLSKMNKMSCASCHQEEKAFTDGLIHFENQTRNTPTLKYASLQQQFFYDNRAGSLEGQIVSVVNNENEFHTDLETFTRKIIEDTSYSQDFIISYEQEATDQSIRNAIASYVRSLTAFNSKFDRNINKKESNLSKQEIKGFNLFMGKAQCGTCHFAPVFNGTVPPYFTDTEMELLGVPNDTTTNQIDNDLGRYYLFETEERKHFFKTPTVRNISLTAPYMHNGVYETLDQVMKFYNHGGGIGMGMSLPYQTLPSDSLHLSEDEIASILAFMKTLEDQPSSNNED